MTHTILDRPVHRVATLLAVLALVVGTLACAGDGSSPTAAVSEEERLIRQIEASGVRECVSELRDLLSAPTALSDEERIAELRRILALCFTPTGTGVIGVVTRTDGDDPDPDGYTVQLTGPASRSSAIGLDDDVLFNSLPGGTYNVQLLGLDSACSVDGANPRAVSLTAGSSAGTTFSILCGEPLPDLDIVQLATGTNHNCVLVVEGAVYCWGRNHLGQLGNGIALPPPTEDPDRHVLQRVVGGHVFTQIASGQDYTCGLEANGDAFCWGRNNDGQLGNGLTEPSSTPVAVGGGHSFSALFGGHEEHTCGLTPSGQALCWGENFFGQLGNGDRDDALLPVAVAGGHSFVELGLGDNHTCGLDDMGDMFCWGTNGDGQLGAGSIGGLSSTPVAVSGGLQFVNLAIADHHSCGLTSDGDAYCWGLNHNGQVGDNTFFERGAPVMVKGDLVFQQLVAGGHHIAAGNLPAYTCGLTAAGQGYCWGGSDDGQRGDGTKVDTAVPIAIGGGHLFSSLAPAVEHTCALDHSGRLFCWGNNDFSRLGVEDETSKGGIPESLFPLLIDLTIEDST